MTEPNTIEAVHNELETALREQPGLRDFLRAAMGWTDEQRQVATTILWAIKAGVVD